MCICTIVVVVRTGQLALVNAAWNRCHGLKQNLGMLIIKDFLQFNVVNKETNIAKKFHGERVMS